VGAVSSGGDQASAIYCVWSPSCETRTIVIYGTKNTRRPSDAPVAVCVALPSATTPGRTKRRASLIICFSRLEVVPHTLSPCQTWPTWAYPARYRRSWLLRPSQCCALHLALRLGRPRTTWSGTQRFHVLHSIQGDLGPLCYTGSSLSARRATLESPDSTACHFGSSLEQPRMAGFSVTMLASVQLI
jgi:hypothetical protein